MIIFKLHVFPNSVYEVHLDFMDRNNSHIHNEREFFIIFVSFGTLEDIALGY